MVKISFSRHMVLLWTQASPLTMHNFLWDGLNTSMCTIIIYSRNPLCLGKYIDDIFLIWNGSDCYLQVFHSISTIVLIQLNSV